MEAYNTNNWVENGGGSHDGVVSASRGVASGANKLCHDSLDLETGGVAH